MVKCKKTVLKALTKGEVPFWEIAKMVKWKNSPEGINKGKGAFGEIAEMVKCKKLP
jgi:hypothetical protein